MSSYLSFGALTTSKAYASGVECLQTVFAVLAPLTKWVTSKLLAAC